MVSVDLPSEGGRIEIIAGSYQGIKGNANTFSPINVYNARLNKGGKAHFSFSENFNTGFMVIEGAIKLNGSEKADVNHFIYFENTGTEIEIEARENSVVLILSGEPINEPIVHYGPFLMNTEEEIQQAISDYNQGKFGYLDE